MYKAILSVIVASALLLVGCSAQPPVPEDHFYRLPDITDLKSRRLASELSVKRLLTDGLHSERALLYSTDKAPLQLKQYHYHHWVDTPPRMLQENIISALRNSGIADNIINYDAASRSEHTLRGKIRKFEQYRRGDRSMVLIDLEFRLDNRSGDPLFIMDYHVEQAAESSAPHDLVMAYGKGIKRVLRNFVQDWQNLK